MGNRSNLRKVMVSTTANFREMSIRMKLYTKNKGIVNISGSEIIHLSYWACLFYLH